MSELFPVEQVSVDSPRKKWMDKYEIKTFDRGECGSDELGDFERWSAGCGACNYVDGTTEDEAIAAWAKAHGIPLWNEVLNSHAIKSFQARMDTDARIKAQVAELLERFQNKRANEPGN